MMFKWAIKEHCDIKEYMDVSLKWMQKSFKKIIGSDLAFSKRKRKMWPSSLSSGRIIKGNIGKQEDCLGYNIIGIVKKKVRLSL